MVAIYHRRVAHALYVFCRVEWKEKENQKEALSQGLQMSFIKSAGLLCSQAVYWVLYSRPILVFNLVPLITIVTL